MKSLVLDNTGLFLSPLDEKHTTIWNDAEEAAQIFLRFYWEGLPVCVQFIIVIDKEEQAKTWFLNFWLFADPLRPANNCFPVFLQIQRVCLTFFAALNTIFQRSPLNSTNY